MKKENYTILSKTESLSSAVSGFWLAYRVYLTILLRVRVGYDISYPTSGNVKTTDWQLVLILSRRVLLPYLEGMV